MARIVLLPGPGSRPSFGRHVVDGAYRSQLLRQACRLRADAYVKDGAIGRDELDTDGAFWHPLDDQSWHLLVVEGESDVRSTVRLTETPVEISARRGKIPHVHSSLVRSDAPIPRIWAAERFLSYAGLKFGPDRPFFWVVGGWAAKPGDGAGADVALASWALTARSRCCGALTIASERHDAFGQLMRTGARPIHPRRSEELFFDARYGCRVGLLGYLVFEHSPRFKRLIQRFDSALATAEVVTPA